MVVNSLLSWRYGSSTGFIPSHVKNRKETTKLQNLKYFRSSLLYWVFVGFTKRIKRIRIDLSKATTPPNLLGMERKIAYANKKYHSGWICTGVTKGLAGTKLSGSINTKGLDSTIIVSADNAIIPLTKSFVEK